MQHIIYVTDDQGNIIDRGNLDDKDKEPTPVAPKYDPIEPEIIYTERDEIKVRFKNGCVPTEEDYAFAVEKFALRSELDTITVEGDTTEPIPTRDIINLFKS